MSENLPTTPPALVKLASVALVAPQATIDIVGIVQTFKHLQAYGSLRSDNAANNDEARITANNDLVDANYDGEQLVVTGAGSLAFEALAIAAARKIGTAAGATSPANMFGGISFFIFDYANAARLKDIAWGGPSWRARTAGNVVPEMGMVGWAAVAAINRLTIRPAVGANFVAGSSLDLYGVT